MAQEIIDITGNTYGFLKVLGFSHMGDRRRSYWTVECLRCGTIRTMRKDAFAYDWCKVISCGCYHRYESSLRLKDKTTGKFIKRI